MSGARRGRAGVRGPNSALTVQQCHRFKRVSIELTIYQEFLASRGINAATIRERAEARARANAATEEQEPGETIAEDQDEGRDSDQQTPEAENIAENSASVAQSERTQRVTVKSKGRQRKKAKRNDDEDDDEVEQDNDKVVSKTRESFSHKNRRNTDTPRAGQIDFCDQCSRRFTVTPYSKASLDGKGLLCHICGKAAPDIPLEKRSAKAAPSKKSNVSFLDGEKRLVPKLQDSCIKVDWR